MMIVDVFLIVCELVLICSGRDGIVSLIVGFLRVGLFMILVLMNLLVLFFLDVIFLLVVGFEICFLSWVSIVDCDFLYCVCYE